MRIFVGSILNELKNRVCGFKQPVSPLSSHWRPERLNHRLTTISGVLMESLKLETRSSEPGRPKLEKHRTRPCRNSFLSFRNAEKDERKSSCKRVIEVERSVLGEEHRSERPHWATDSSLCLNHREFVAQLCKGEKRS